MAIIYKNKLEQCVASITLFFFQATQSSCLNFQMFFHLKYIIFLRLMQSKYLVISAKEHYGSRYGKT